MAYATSQMTTLATLAELTGWLNGTMYVQHNAVVVRQVGIVDAHGNETS